jgi:hypothetical protein
MRYHKRDPINRHIRTQNTPFNPNSLYDMSIYLCPPNAGVVNPIFKAAGIAGYMPGKMTDLPAFAYPGLALCLHKG